METAEGKGNIMKKNFFFSLLIVGGVVAARLLPHSANFSPLASLVLLLPWIFPKQKFAIPLILVGLFISDLWLGFHGTMPYVYGSYIFIGILGKKTKSRSFVLPVISSLLFYSVTNFGVWVQTEMYSKDLQGLLRCYIMAIPFLKMTILGDLFYYLIGVLILKSIDLRFQGDVRAMRVRISPTR